MSKRTEKKNCGGEHLFKVAFEPLGQRGSSPSGQSLLEIARQLGVDLISLCGGLGKCGCCKIQIAKGKASTVKSSERQVLTKKELHLGYRLACQTYPESGLIVHVIPESLSTSQRVQVEGTKIDVQPDPLVRGYEVRLSAPSLSDLKADDQRLVEELKQVHHVDCRDMDAGVLRELS